MLYKVVLTFKSVDETLVMKAIEQYFHMVLFIMLYKVVLSFKSVHEAIACDHSVKVCLAVLSCARIQDFEMGKIFEGHV